jgi:cytochrome c5
MNKVIKRLTAGSLTFSLSTFLLFELTTNESVLGGVSRPIHASFGLEAGLVRSAGAQRTRSPLKRKPSFVSDLFRNNCARCHGADGRADTPLGRTYQTPDLTDPDWWRKNSKITSTASLMSIVSRGKGGMPAFGKKLKRTEIRALIGYVRRFKSQTSANR